METRIRIATPEDAEALLMIYSPYVENTAITFEYTVPSVEEFTERIRHILEKYPYLVAEGDGEILGYAYASAFHTRAACGWAVETSVYVRKDCKCQGIGSKLYAALEKALLMQNIINLNASIAFPIEEDEYLTKDSAEFHERMGYRFVGEFYKCGYKFKRWYSLIWMEKFIKDHTEIPEPVKLFDEIRENFQKILDK